MKPIGKIVGCPSDPRSFKTSPRIVDNSTFIGVEIELENVGNFGSSYFRDSSFWSIVGEGSLRNSGREYVMQVKLKHEYVPICGKDVVTALDFFDSVVKKYIDNEGITPKATDRTSIHIHIDVRDLSKEQLVSFIILYTIFEPVFYSLFGKGRENNPYCKPISTEECLIRISEIIGSDSEREIGHALSKGNKYDACNILSICERGSLEFRLHEGTYDSELILNWINLLLILKDHACKEQFDISNLPEQASQLGMSDFLKLVFGKYTDNILENAVEADILRGIRVAQDMLIYSGLEDSSKKYNTSSNGKRAGEDSVLHGFAKANKRSVYL